MRLRLRFGHLVVQKVLRWHSSVMCFAIWTVSVYQALLIRFNHPLASPQVQERSQAKLVCCVTVSVETQFDGIRVPASLVSGTLQSPVNVV